ncbi:MAG: hypothetical protein GWM98_24520 [Nitrospinaceae bacterium]|nr:hypothetical protein [Nitrospinaceae bacterium]NIR57046.1 hypothetical protein [Nitrospinaceae bacterium]NIS87501.1 hypothetical protein [Nitrospinaceae bacterium]NIT84355.1 hypothetical protein [Nitrospinaceae bacterium]NIU46542.1 hypothetical protein [Nitrospinaceae bacterium]
MKKIFVRLVTLATAATLFAVSSAQALDMAGSLGKGRHKTYIPAVSNPFFNETPFITTELRPVYIHNDIPDNIPLQGVLGGKINLWAVQLRLALTERLGLIVTQNGWADVNLNVPGWDDDGFANAALGFKYAFFSDPKEKMIMTAGLTYEGPTGNLKAGPVWLQGNGDGFIDVFLTGQDRVNKISLQVSAGAKMALDTRANTSWFHYSVHLDYEILPNIFPVAEINGFVPIREAERNPLAFEGLDLFSIGGSEPGSVITFAGGGRFKISDHLLAGVTYQNPLTDREDLLDWRVTADLIFHF